MLRCFSCGGLLRHGSRSGSGSSYSATRGSLFSVQKVTVTKACDFCLTVIM